MKHYFCETDTTLFIDCKAIDVFTSKKLIEVIKEPELWNRKKLRFYLKEKYGQKIYSIHMTMKDSEVKLLQMNLANIHYGKRMTKENEDKKNNQEEIVSENSDNKEILKSLMVVVESLKSSNENLLKELKESHKANQAMQEKLLMQQIADLKDIIKTNKADGGAGGGLDIMQLMETIQQFKNLQGVTPNGNG